jgi:hypothetical protein
MTAPEADLTGWSAKPFTGGGYTHDVYRRGEGPGVVLIPEIPGIHPGVLGLGNHLVDNGFTVRSRSATRLILSDVFVWQGNSLRLRPTSTGRLRISCAH